MTWLRIIISSLADVFSKQKREQELGAELREHLDALTEDHIRRGMSPQEARYAARRDFGGLEQTKEAYREQRGLPFLETFLQDVRFGVRLMTKNAALSGVIVTILAVGIGAGTSLYSLIDACLIRTTITRAVGDRWEVVRAYLPHQKMFVNFMSVPEILEVKQLRELFEEVGAVHGDSFTLTRGEYP